MAYGKQVKTIQRAQLLNKKVIIRCDLDVVKNGKIKDDERLVKATETISYLLKKKVQHIIIIGHNGKPKAQEKDLSLKPVAQWFEKKLKRKVHFESYPYPERLSTKASITVLENLRFYPEEKQNDQPFAKQLASYADIYVNNAFASSHRKHASIVGIPQHIKGYAGLTLQKEIKMLSKITNKPPRPLYALVGFAKIHDKVEILQNLLKRADKVCIGGAVIFTFLAAQGKEIGKSLLDEQSLALAKKLLKQYSKKIILPLDVVVQLPNKTNKTVPINQIPKTAIGLDLGEQSIELFSKELQKAGVIFWNGPMGKFEQKPYDHATNQIGQAITSKKVIVGGGDTTKAIKNAGIYQNMTHVSTGGGASLQFIVNPRLVGIKAIMR